MTTPAPASSKLLTRTEAAERLGVKPSTLDTWASTGRYNLRFVKVGRFRYYRETDLAAFLDRKSHTHTGEYPERRGGSAA